MSRDGFETKTASLQSSCYRRTFGRHFGKRTGVWVKVLKISEQFSIFVFDLLHSAVHFGNEQ